ncbi:hypothetical protein CXF64_17275 [Pseudoalteromonas sp. GutCa3]|nr:hypothetical protein CXF75_20220 [Pseudoalteromonas arctica]PKG69186.1 hypothetical protein CXF64_17275 [Pseudoalteromonas sp. GutCa3]PKH90127.1 hypothetical protein CXF76_18650 [Pseudoalteromonas sp. 78C3]
MEYNIMRELNVNEIKDVNGGNPIVVALIAYRIYKIVKAGTKATAAATALGGAGVVGNEVGKALAN